MRDPQHNMNTMQKGFGLIGILIVVGIIAILGVGALKMGFLERNPFVPTDEEKSAIEMADEMKDVMEEKNSEMMPNDDTAKDETADWKTYHNEEYGFEVKYPETIKGIEQYKLLFQEFSPGTQEIFIGRIGTADFPGLFLIGFIIKEKPSDFVSLDSYLTKIEDECRKEIQSGVAGGSCSIKEVMVGNEKISAVVSRESSAVGNTGVTLHFDKGNDLFLVNYNFAQGVLNTGDSEEELLFLAIQQILSTFKFID